MKEKFISIGFGGIVGIVTYFLGGIDVLITVFATILVLDTATGMLKAWNLGEYESKKFRDGFVKKSGYILGVILSVQLDKVMGDNNVLRNTVITFFIVNESLSICENLGRLGVVFPSIIGDALKTLKNKAESKNTE